MDQIIESLPKKFRAMDGETVFAPGFALPSGYSAKIKSSSDEKVISKNGHISPPGIFTLVKLTYELEDAASGASSEFETSALVPAIRDPENNVFKNACYSDLKYGFLVHWFHWLPKPDGARHASINDFADSFEVEKLADEFLAAGAEYVNITDFHALGTVLHPSAAVDFWRGEGIFTTGRDVLMELILAFGKRGIRVSIFTHPLDNHDFPPEQQELLGANDPAGGYRRWNDFVNDVYADIASRYGKYLYAMGFDSEWGQSGDERWKNKLDIPRLRETILSYAPDLPLVALSPANEMADYSITEVFTPAWLDPKWSLGDIWDSNLKGAHVRNTDKYPGYYRAVAMVLNEHWTCTASIENSAPMNYTAESLFRYAVMQIACSTEGPGIMWGISPYINGQWQPGAREALTGANELMKPIYEALRGIKLSGSYRTRSGYKLEELPDGISATRSLDNRYEYILVLNPPDGGILSLPATQDGKAFATAQLIKGNGLYESCALEQNASGVSVALPQGERWDPLCTAIRLTIDPSDVAPVNLALHKPVLPSTSKESPSYGIHGEYAKVRLTDGINSSQRPIEKWEPCLYGWSSAEHSDENHSEWATVDLLGNYSISKIILHPINGAADPGDGFPVDYSVSISTDNKTWTQVCEAKNQPKTGNAVEIACNLAEARYIKAQATKLRKSGAKYAFRLAEIEAY